MRLPHRTDDRRSMPARARRTLRLWVLLNRRWLAAACAGLSVWAMLQVVAPGAPPSTSVSVAARDLEAGRVLRAADLRQVELVDSALPDGVETAPVGRTLTAAMRAGEVVTDVRLLSPGLPEHLEGLSGVPVRISDADVARLLRVGDRVDVVAVDPQHSEHRSVATDALVIGLPNTTKSTAGVGRATPAGALVVLGVPADAAEALAAAGVGETLQVVFAGAATPDF